MAVIVPNKFEKVRVGLGNLPLPVYLNPSAFTGILVYGI